MRKVISFIGLFIVLFSFIFMGLGSCSDPDPDPFPNIGGDNGSDVITHSCSDGYVKCGNTGKCCPWNYPYHGSNGKCYSTLGSCRQNASSCTTCDGAAITKYCNPGNCLITQFGTCCPSNYPYYAGGQCWKTAQDAHAKGYHTVYGCCKNCYF